VSPGNGAPPLLEVRGLRKHFPLRGGVFQRTHAWVRAVDGVSFDVYPTETLGIVGESGCGKSTLARLILRLIEPDAGTVRFGGEDVRAATPPRMKRLRRDMQLVFQDPYASLNPRLTIEDAVAFSLIVHGTPRAEARDRARARNHRSIPTRRRSSHPRRAWIPTTAWSGRRSPAIRRTRSIHRPAAASARAARSRCRAARRRRRRCWRSARGTRWPATSTRPRPRSRPRRASLAVRHVSRPCRFAHRGVADGGRPAREKARVGGHFRRAVGARGGAVDWLQSPEQRRPTPTSGRQHMRMGRAAIFVSLALSICVAPLAAQAQQPAGPPPQIQAAQTLLMTWGSQKWRA